MLSVYTKEEGFIPINNRQNYYYSMQYSGFHRLYFDVSVKDSINKYLINEAIIQNEDNRFLIKGINRRIKNVTFTCELDMDEWRETVYKDTANDERFKTKTLEEILNVIKPENWVIRNANIRSLRRTPELTDATPYDVLVSLEEQFNIVFDINVINAEITIIDPESFVYDGLYLTPELNMTGITWNGSSSNFCTKLFAYGKTDDDGNTINISSVNNGKEYIEDHTYSNRTVTLVWRDERYTDPQSLFDDARKKMDELCIPKMSYDVLINDLARVNKDYDFLQFGLYKQVKAMIDENVSIVQKVVSYDRYYDKEDKNVVTLSNESQKLTSQVSSLLGGSTNQTIDGSLLDQAKKEATFLINSFSTKGYKYETENEIFFLDRLPKEDAKYVMRMNLGGIAFSVNGWSGPYLTAWTIDGKFNADFVTTGTLNAVLVKAGILSDKEGKNFWNLDTGEFKLTASAKVGDTTLEQYVNTKIDDSMTQEEIFNALTNNGAIKGIFMKNGKLYVNANYVNADTLSAISADLGTITGGSLNIGNGNFVVTNGGILTAKGATIQGAITATSGAIGGFNIGDYLSAAGTVTFDFTETDKTTIRNIIDGKITATSTQMKRYDLNGDGKIRSNEYVKISNIISSGNKLSTRFVINPTFKNVDNNDGVFLIDVGGIVTKVTNTGQFYAQHGTFSNLYVNALSNFYGNIYANCGIVLPNENTTEEPDNRLMGTRTDGVLVHLASVSSGNNCVFGYGTYLLEDGSSNYYGNKVALISKNGITADGIQLVLKAGMSLTITKYAGAGHVSDGRQAVVISVPLGRLVDATSVTVNSCYANIRVVGGDYVGEGYVSTGYNYCANSNYTVSATLVKANGCIRLKIDQNTTYGTTTTCPNNSPIAVDILTMKLTFS